RRASQNVGAWESHAGWDHAYSSRINTNRRCRPLVMPGLDPGIHRKKAYRSGWIAGSSPAMTPESFSKPLDQAGIDQQPVEAARLRAASAGVKKSLAALENPFLLGEGGIERQPGRLLHHERKIGPLDRVERGSEADGFKIDRIDRVIGRVIARIVG